MTSDIDPSSTRLFLIRHAETEWSLSGRHTGISDVALTANGQAQARRLRPLLETISFARVLTSPRQRARQTCDLAILDRHQVVEPLLAEWDYGDYEGLTTAEILEAVPSWNIFRDGCLGGETAEQVSARADKLVAHLRVIRGDIGLFSHGHFGRVLGARWIGLDIIEAQHFKLETASLSILGYKPFHLDVPVVIRWNMLPTILSNMNRAASV